MRRTDGTERKCRGKCGLYNSVAHILADETITPRTDARALYGMLEYRTLPNEEVRGTRKKFGAGRSSSVADSSSLASHVRSHVRHVSGTYPTRITHALLLLDKHVKISM